MSIPEPKTFNGGPGETGAFVTRATGARREPQDVPDLRGTGCQTCGGEVRTVYSLADVGVFCSSDCRAKATVPALPAKRSA